MALPEPYSLGKSLAIEMPLRSKEAESGDKTYIAW